MAGVDDYGIIVSETGFSVHTAADKNLALKSGFKLLKVFKEGAVANASPIEDIAHDLGYLPQFLVWVDDDTGIKSAGAGLATGNDDFALAYADTADLRVFTTNGGDIKYFIFYEPLATGTAPVVVSTNDYGIIVTEAGKGVSTANILEQTFNSEKNSLKIAVNDNEFHTVNTSYSFLIAHGLSTTPGYLIYFEVDSSGKWWSENEKDTLSGKNVELNAWTTGTFLVASLTSSASCTVKIVYYILADPAI